MAGNARNKAGKPRWSFDALLGTEELARALGRFPTLTILTAFRRIPAGGTGVVSLEDYLANYEKYAEGLTGRQTVDGRVLSKLGAYMTLDATMITYAPAPDSAFQLWGSSKPLLHVGSVEMTYFRESDKMRNNCSDAKNPIHFGLSFDYTDAYVHQADASNSDVRSRFPNIDLIEGLAEWVRENSEPCKVRLQGREQVLTVRLGREAARWVNEHTMLARLGLSVRTSHPVKTDPSWLTPTVLQLARVIRDEKDFTALPILSDALEESGCADRMVLQHCREQREHVRGCWVVDMLLADR